MFLILFCAVLHLLCYPGGATGLLQGAEAGRPCNPHEQTSKPNFSKYTKYRVSERKCLEYVWEMSNREHVKNCTNTQQTGLAENTVPTEYPHMGAVGWWSITAGTWKFLCGSSLISSNFALTAAHCTEVTNPEFSPSRPVIVRFGMTSVKYTANPRPPLDMKIKTIITEPHYVPPYKYFDIALLKFEKELKFDKFIQPACLWGKKDYKRMGNEFTVTGWSINDSDSLSVNILKVAEVAIADTRLCNKILTPYCQRTWCRVKSHQICAGNPNGGPDTCAGDSGGPLQFSLANSPEGGSIHSVVGVTSFGMSSRRCGAKYTPGIYTRVYSFIEWIENNVWPEEQ